MATFAESEKRAVRWFTRGMPLALGAALAFVLYVTVDRICVQDLINRRNETVPAIVILVLGLVFLVMFLASYLRNMVVIYTDPGLVSLGPVALQRRATEKQAGKNHHTSGRYPAVNPDPDPDSPGLELFYSKDFFVCETDGRPRWCSTCCNWKPDRAHHSRELGRCVLRMDHFCPWAGGIVAENSFKFFVQFVMYTTCLCAIALGTSASTLKRQISAGESPDAFVIAQVVMSAFFGAFAGAMTLSAGRYVLLNLTNVEMLGYHTKVYQLAVRVPRGLAPSDKFSTIAFPITKGGNPPGSSQTYETVGNGHNATEKTENTMTAHTGPAAGAEGHEQAASTDTIAARGRDALAYRTFAIVKTEAGENPWDLGILQNVREVMGTRVIDWFLPIRRSPCRNHDSPEGFYRMGHVVRTVCKRFGIDNIGSDETDMVALRNLGASGV